MFKTPEKFRIRTGAFASDESYGPNGVFVIQQNPSEQIRCIASNGEGWEHVSVSINRLGNTRIPSWGEMVQVKNLFWDEEDCVVQFHPPKSKYVNCHPNVLHLWRKIGHEYETPDISLIGIR